MWFCCTIGALASMRSVLRSGSHSYPTFPERDVPGTGFGSIKPLARDRNLGHRYSKSDSL